MERKIGKIMSCITFMHIGNLLFQNSFPKYSDVFIGELSAIICKSILNLNQLAERLNIFFKRDKIIILIIRIIIIKAF